MEKTLIAMDDGPASEIAFQFYIEEIHQTKGFLLLLHVVEPLVISSNQTILQIFKVRENAAVEEKRRVKEFQEKYQDKMRNYGIQGRIMISYYNRNPGKVICDTAKKNDCSLVIVGKGNGGNGTGIGASARPQTKPLGSVCKHVIHNARCPVAIVPSSDPGLECNPYAGNASRRMSAVDLPPAYSTARRFSLAVPVLRRKSHADITQPNLGSSCPDISEVGVPEEEDQSTRNRRKPEAGKSAGSEDASQDRYTKF